jgi:hypothetical protein
MALYFGNRVPLLANYEVLSLLGSNRCNGAYPTEGLKWGWRWRVTFVGDFGL